MTHVTGSSHRNQISDCWEREALTLPRSNVVTVEQIQHLFSVPDTTTIEGIGDRTILALTILCGLNIDEINRMEISDFDLQNRILIIKGRRGEDRRVSVPEDICKHLNEWISIRSRINIQTLALFVPPAKVNDIYNDD